MKSKITGLQQNGFVKVALILMIGAMVLVALFYTRLVSVQHNQSIYRTLDLSNETAYAKQSSVLDSTNASITNSRNNAIVKAIKQVGPSIVNISTIEVQQVVVNPWFGLFDFGIPQERKYRGLGSGVIVSSDGYIITNEHVIENAQSTKVILSDGREFKGTVVGEDFQSDIAVLKVDGKNLPKATLGDSSNLLIGEWAIAIGNPFGFAIKDPRPTATIGIISALDRSLEKDGRFYYNLIQTDATINPGNSGGALVNSLGQVIGLNTMIYSTSGGSQGIGFAIPVNPTKKIVQKLTKYGTIILPKIGLEYQDLSRKIIKHLGLNITSGVLVTNVQKNSPAQTAGFQRLDIIQSVEGQHVDSVQKIESITRIFDVGDKITFSLIRDKQKMKLSLVVSKLLREYTVWGITVKEVNPKFASNYKNKGVVVMKIRKGSFLNGRNGMKSGDLIYSINKSKTDSIENFRKLVRKISRGQSVVIFFERNSREYYLQAIVR